MRRYPVGIQTFEDIRSENLLYVDKTEYIYRMTHTNGNYFFLSRPRRFGKSLLVSTMQSYFEGRKDLFEGLAMERLEKDWTVYPVLHFSMASGKHMEREALERYLDQRLRKEEQRFGIKPESEDLNDRFTHLIEVAYEQTGQRVVVLIDEYDAPLLDVVHEETQLESLRHVMHNFYSPLKDADPYLRFVFLTGITKFSQMSIFSELNNITNVSMDDEYAGICGITKEELLTQMQPDIEMLAEKQGLTMEQTVERLKDHYDGYHFSGCSPDVFNPFSLLSCFAKRKFDSYWFGTGTPTYLIQMMRKFEVQPSEIGPVEALASAFDAPTESLISLTPLLYQSGYITIKSYDEESRLYTLDLPNKEIKVGLFESLLPYYLNGIYAQKGSVTMVKMAMLLRQRDMDGALRLLQTFLETVPYCRDTHYEGHYQQVLFIIFSLLTDYMVDVEVHTSRGRVDVVVLSRTDLYLIEIKMDRDAQTALRQIELKDYRRRFALSGKPVTKVGINFNSEKGNLDDWAIRKE